jgi:uncharacterized delta-60 repeat protein
VGSFNELQLAKYNTSGTIQWQRRFGGSVDDYGYGIAVDSSGNVYVIGYTASGVDPRDIIFAKFNTSGAIQWQRTLTNSGGNDYGYGIAVDSSANVYIIGQVYAGGNYNFQLAKYNTSGTIQWQRKLGGYGDAYGQGIALDSSANVYVIGYSNPTAPSGTYNFQLAKYDTTGAIQWQRRLSSSSGNDYGYGIAVDSSGNVYVTGNTNSPVDLQLAKYNTSGVIQWQRKLGYSVTLDYGYGLAVDSSSNVYVVGRSNARVYPSTTMDLLLAKYDTNGSIQWQRVLGSTGTDEGFGIAVDTSGNVYVAGYSNVSGSYDFVMAKLPGDGTGTGVYSVGGYSYTYDIATLTDASSSLTDAASSLTDSTSSLTDASTSFTDTASSLTSNTTAI